MIEKLNNICEKIIEVGLSIFNLYETKIVTPFVDIFDSFNGGTFKSKDYVKMSNHKLITIKNIDDDGFNISNVSFLDETKVDKKYLLSVGDILLTMTGNIGRVGIVDRNHCYLNQRVLKIKSYSQSYLFFFLTKYKKDIILLGTGTAQKNLSLSDLNKMNVNNSKEQIIKFKQYDFLFNYLTKTKQKIVKLTNIKENLLKKYF